MFGQLNLPLSDSGGPIDPDRFEQSLKSVSAGISAILNALPVPRRNLSQSTKDLHLKVILQRRNGYYSCCQSVRVCDAEGKLPCAVFDHFYGRNRAESDATWCVCVSCNRDLEDLGFKASARANFESYQHALLGFQAAAQQHLFD